MRLTEDELATRYVFAKRAVVDHGYIDEIAWQARVQLHEVTQTTFLREAAWVVLNTGMRESVVRMKFDALERIFGGFESSWVWRHRKTIRLKALEVFAHPAKIGAIIDIAGHVRTLTNEDLVQRLRQPESFLVELPYIGPVTWRHLAKNLGASTSKPDRHLVRFTEQVGRLSVDELCAEIADWVGEPVEIVDVVLWRWSVLNGVQCGAHCHPVPVPTT